ncbi:MAG: pilus assembly protein PilM [Verrucomicrobia bacterium]|nr:pilus assembly protein PilM [Verrucomicrobiota bacterium]
MADSPTFISINFGMGSLKVAEFDRLGDGMLFLRDYVVRPLGFEGSMESRREATLQTAISEIFAERQYAPGMVTVVAPGFQVFSKTIKFPKVDNSKVSQLIQYEAQQNIPFPLEEAVWDKQQLPGSDSEVEVLLVAIKKPLVESLGRICESVKQEITLIDAPATALLNAFKYNYPDYEGTSLILDIGAKTSNVILVEGDNFFLRSVNIGSENITRDFSTESKLRFPEADQIKVEQGFVGLGGAYEDPKMSIRPPSPKSPGR